MKKKIALAGLLVVVIVVVILVATNRSISSTSIVNNYSISAQSASAASYGQNTFVFSNGNALETYNVMTGVATPLSANVGINHMDTITTSGSNYVLFHDQHVDQNGALAAQLTSSNFSPTLDYWWLYNATTNKFSALPQSVVFAKVIGQDVYATLPGSGGESLVTYSAANMHQISAIKIPGSVDYFPFKSGFLLQTPENNVLYFANGSNTQVLSSTIIIGVDQTGTTAFALQPSGSNRKLITVNLSNYSTKVVANNVVGQPVWLPSGLVLYAAGTSSNNQKLYEYNLATSKLSLWKVNNVTGSSSPNPLVLINSQSAIVQLSQSSYVLIGNNIANPAKANL